MINSTICVTTFVQEFVGIDDGNLHETDHCGEVDMSLSPWNRCRVAELPTLAFPNQSEMRMPPSWMGGGVRSRQWRAQLDTGIGGRIGIDPILLIIDPLIYRPLPI